MYLTTEILKAYRVPVLRETEFRDLHAPVYIPDCKNKVSNELLRSQELGSTLLLRSNCPVMIIHLIVNFSTVNQQDRSLG